MNIRLMLFFNFLADLGYHKNSGHQFIVYSCDIGGTSINV